MLVKRHCLNYRQTTKPERDISNCFPVVVVFLSKQLTKQFPCLFVGKVQVIIRNNFNFLKEVFSLGDYTRGRKLCKMLKANISELSN